MRKIGQSFSFLIPVIAFAVLVVLMAGCESREKAKEEENKAYHHRVIDEAWSKGNLDVLDEQFSTNFVLHDPPSPDIEGLDALKQYITEIRSAFPDIQFTIDEIIAEGDIVSWRWTGRGTHIGQSPHLGIPPTGKKVTFTGCSVDYWVDDKVVEEWSYGNYLGLIQQLGFKIVPPEGQGE